MAEPTSEPARSRRWPSRVVAGVLVAIAALTFGVTTASVEGSFGPHEAQYSITTDDLVTVDLGPLGTLQIDSPLPLTLGARVTVQEIPASFAELDRPTTLQALTGDLDAYVQFFSAPQTTVRDAAEELAADAAVRTLLAAAVLVGGWFAVSALLGAARRAELADRIRPQRARIALGAALALTVAVVATSSVEPGQRPAESRPSSPVFAGTPLEGARVTGRLGGVIDTYGAQALAAYRENQAFYQRADEALATAWATRERRERNLGSPEPEGDYAVLVVVSDLHCNVGMAPLITTLATSAGADVVLDAGDTTMNGTTVERYCVSSFARAIPSGVRLVTSPGNHDSAETSAMYAAAGATVLAGEVLDVEGVRILGDSDPNQTRLGQGTSSSGESLSDEARRLADVACSDGDGVDLLLIHTPDVGLPGLRRGCVPAQVSGHLHTRHDPEQIGLGIRYVNSSSAGARLGQPTLGPLHGDAEMTVLRFDRGARRLVDYQLVTVTPQATVTVAPRIAWPPIQPLVPTWPGPTRPTLAPPAPGPTSPATASPTPATQQG